MLVKVLNGATHNHNVSIGLDANAWIIISCRV